MARYRGPRLRITRRLGDLPGLTRKAAKRSYPPGQHGQARRKRSEYAIRLEEKRNSGSTTGCLNVNSCAM